MEMREKTSHSWSMHQHSTNMANECTTLVGSQQGIKPQRFWVLGFSMQLECWRVIIIHQ